MTMTEWFLEELESEAAKSRRALEQAPAGKRNWKPHERSMEFGYLSERVGATASRGDSRHISALGASSWADDGVPAPARIEGCLQCTGRRPTIRASDDLTGLSVVAAIEVSEGWYAAVFERNMPLLATAEQRI